GWSRRYAPARDVARHSVRPRSGQARLDAPSALTGTTRARATRRAAWTDGASASRVGWGRRGIAGCERRSRERRRFGQDAAKHVPVNVPDRDEQRGDDGPDDEAEPAEKRDATERRDQNQEVRQLGVLAD